MSATSVDREVEQRLSEKAVRYTRGRRTVVNALAEAAGPLSAAELSDSLGATVPLSSLYRTLAVLEEAGIVEPHFGARAVTRYELAEWIKGHHHHFVCNSCGSVEDIDVTHTLELEVSAVIAKIARTAAFEPSSHVLEIEGRCRECR